MKITSDEDQEEYSNRESEKTVHVDKSGFFGSFKAAVTSSMPYIDTDYLVTNASPSGFCHPDTKKPSV